jgi:hypothetical protein
MHARAMEDNITITYPGDDQYGRKEYVGHCSGGLRHGPGTVRFRDGAHYQGEWVCDLMHGEGAYTSIDGSMYVGQWKDGKRHGRGTSYHSNGEVYYDGEWENDKRHGHGECRYQSGNRCRGEWVNGLHEGWATYIWADGKESYEGQFLKGVYHGKGTYFDNGFRFECEWKEGMEHGNSRRISPHGRVRSETWHYDEMLKYHYPVQSLLVLCVERIAKHPELVNLSVELPDELVELIHKCKG